MENIEGIGTIDRPFAKNSLTDPYESFASKNVDGLRERSSKNGEHLQSA
jgi:hypothetical protein